MYYIYRNYRLFITARFKPIKAALSFVLLLLRAALFEILQSKAALLAGTGFSSRHNRRS